MQGSSIYLIAAYALVWLGLFIYLAVVAMRMRAVRTELAAVEELVREYQEQKDANE
jgi:CcmD family protein